MTETPSRGDGARAGKFLGHTLPPGTRIGSFEITGLIGEGGFGIVYLAFDESLQRQVALKEYMPSSLASRASESHDISVKSDRYAETFSAGLKSFVNEARLLARFDHASLVKVYQFFEANRTAYMAMPYYEGPTLKRALAEMSRPPDEATLREWLRPLLNALAVMHKEHCYHRDIAPDNILLTPSGPLLLDFGAARRVIGDMTHALTVVLKPGYAPIEQYGEAASMAQGPWTDLYAMASVVYYAITGRPPTTSVERVMGDELASLSSQARGRYSEPFLEAIDIALSVRPRDRPQDVAAFCELLNGGLEADDPGRFRASGFQSTGFDVLAPAMARFAPPGAESTRPTVQLPPAETIPASTARLPEAARTEAAAPQANPAAPAVTIASDPPAPSKMLLPALAAAGVLGFAALAFYLGMRPGGPPQAPASNSSPGSSAAPAAAAPVQAQPQLDAAPAAATSGRQTTTSPLPAPTGDAPRPIESVQEKGKADASGAPTPLQSKPRSTAAAKTDSRAAAPAPVKLPRTDAPPKNAGVKPAKCSDILQKASLEPISPEEAEYLRKECR